MFVQTSSFTPSATQNSFTFTVVSQNDMDHCILIDAVIIWPTAAQPAATLALGSLTDFENPVIEGQYDYNSLVWANQPWTWTAGLGGRAKIGSPFGQTANTETDTAHIERRTSRTDSATLHACLVCVGHQTRHLPQPRPVDRR